MKKNRLRWLAGILAAVLLWPEIPIRAEEPVPDFSLYAQSAVLMDAETGRILYEKNGETVRPMASTTKIMTCILALEEGNPESIYTVSSYASSMPKVKLGASEGQQYRQEDLLYSLMLESHNDTAVILAEGIAGSVPAFAERMNAKAREIGAEDTHFVTPNGLDAEDADGIHATTAADLARILRYCIMQSPKREEFLEITRTVSYTFSDAAGEQSYTLNNKNSFLNMMEGALTGKTGFTGNAGYCYVGALRRGDRTYIVALLACGWPNNKSYKWTDTRNLMEFGLANYERREIFRTDAGMPELAVTGGVTDHVALTWEGSVQELAAEGEKAEVSWYLPDSLEAPVASGETVGRARISLDGVLLAEIPIRTAAEVAARTLSGCLDEIFTRFFLRNPAF